MTWNDRLRAVATYDFSPQASARVRAFAYHPLGILLGAGVASLLCGLFLHSQGFVLAGGVVAVVALGVLWPGMTVRGLTGTLGFDRPRAVEGEAVEAHLLLGNRLPWAAWGLAVRGGLGGGPRELVAGIATAPRRRTVLCRWEVRPPERGVYPKRVPRLFTGFPFGLWENSRPLGVGSRLTVWPRTFPVGPVPPTSGSTHYEGSVSRGKVGSHGDCIGVRPYRRGDPPRRIHWGQSAKQDRLIVCELEANSRPVVQLLLDTDPAVHVGTGSDSSREWAVRVAASFAKGWLADGAQVGLAFGRTSIPAAAGQAQLATLLDALAGLDDAPARPLEELVRCPDCRGDRDGVTIVITTDRAGPVPPGVRAVVLASAGFGGEPSAARQPLPWLAIDSPATVPESLKGRWAEARHGS